MEYYYLINSSKLSLRLWIYGLSYCIGVGIQETTEGGALVKNDVQTMSIIVLSDNLAVMTAGHWTATPVCGC